MSTLEWSLQGLLLLLLAVLLPVAVRLERGLSVLRGQGQALKEGAAGFAGASREAEAAVARLRALSEAAARELGDRSQEAEALRDDLRFLTERASGLADRLEAAIREARPLAEARRVPPDEGVAPRSKAELDLLQALRLTR